MAEELDPSEEPQKIVVLNSKRQDRGNFDGPPVDLPSPSEALRSQAQQDAEDKLASLRRETWLNAMFPDNTHSTQFAIAFEAVDAAEKTLYIDTLLKYSEAEPESHKTLGVATRLEHFEKSDEFKETPLKIKLSDIVRKGTAAEVAQQQREASMIGGAESPNGLSRGEGNASVNALANVRKAAENTVQGGASLAGALTSLLGSVPSPLTPPLKAVSGAGLAMYHKIKGDSVVRQEKVTDAAVSKSMQDFGKTVDEICNLPAETPASKVQPLMDKAEKQAADLGVQIRSQGREGVVNATDTTLTEKQKLSIKNPAEVEEAGESNSKKLAGLTDKLLKAPALEGEGKEQLKEKAKVMAMEAAEMIRKIIDSIRNMFNKANAAKAEGPGLATPSTGQSLRM